MNFLRDKDFLDARSRSLIPENLAWLTFARRGVMPNVIRMFVMKKTPSPQVATSPHVVESERAVKLTNIRRN